MHFKSFRLAFALMTILGGSSPIQAQVVQVVPGFNVAYAGNKFGTEAVSGIPHDYVKIPPAKEYYLDYQVYFENDWEWVQGGKLPGLVGGDHTSGCRPIEPDGWSSRFMWHQNGGAHFYYYHQNRQSNCGDTRDFANGRTLKKNAWNRITLRTVVNTPGQSNGLAQLWLNGEKVVDVGNIKWRGNVAETVALVDQVSLQTFYGGSTQDWAPSHTTHARFSILVVRTNLPDFTVPFDPTTAIRNPSFNGVEKPVQAGIGAVGVIDLQGRWLAASNGVASRWKWSRR